MHIIRFRSLESLEPWSAQWNQLTAGNPFRCWEWQSSWWRAYGQDINGRPAELFVLGAFAEDGSLVGVAPWYLQWSPASGVVLRFLGTGDVCSEYLTVLCQPGREEEVTRAIAGWLIDRLGSAPDDDLDDGDVFKHWDLLELSSVAQEDRAIALLIQHLTTAGAAVHRREGMPCWRLDLPPTWEEYLALLSKPVRRKARRVADSLQAGRAVMRSVTNPDELRRGFEILVDLHQQRRQSLGQPGCFSSPQFTAFHHDVAEGLLARGTLHLQWLEIDGQPMAIEYQFYEDRVLYAYQSGVDPAALEHEPGYLALVNTLRQSIADGVRAIDFLRGNESYKSQWRATPRPVEEIRVVAPTTTARLRNSMWAAGDSLKGLVKSGLALAGVSRNAEG